MAFKGVMNKIAWVDLSTGEIRIETPDEAIYRKYLGGYGLGAYYLYKRLPAKADPLGPEAILGFATGPLTGTDAISGCRFTLVGKSPKTGGWGDANCGGKWGPALKQAGLDAIFFSGISDKPVLAVVENGEVKLVTASEYWGLDCVEAESKIRAKYGKSAHSAVIGPSGERVSALACVINDGGRAAARSGLGMVMGSKRLKAVVAVATEKVPVAEPTKLTDLRKSLQSQFYKDENRFYAALHHVGTPAFLEPGVLKGDTPIKNWAGTVEDFTGYGKIAGKTVVSLQTSKYGCWRCPIACGGRVKVPKGAYAGEGHKPEYETLAAFGAMCLNDNLESICKVNDICNRAGMDTISAGATVAFAIECFEAGLISETQTGGLKLSWGNHEAIVALIEQMATGKGFGGEVLADGIQKAVERIGSESSKFAMTCGREEVPMHDPRYGPGYAMSYVLDATPARHTQLGAYYPEMGFVPFGIEAPLIREKYTYTGKAESHRIMSAFGHVVNASGLCQFASMVAPASAVPEYLSHALGIDISMPEILEIGERIACLRIAFNLREGIKNKETYKLPDRILGTPPLKVGPSEGVTVDNEIQIREYYRAMGWDPETGIPGKSVYERLGLDFVDERGE